MMFRNQQSSITSRLFSKYKVQLLVAFVILLYFTSFYTYSSSKKVTTQDNQQQQQQQQQHNTNHNNHGQQNKGEIDIGEHVDGTSMPLNTKKDSEGGTGGMDAGHGKQNEADPNHQNQHPGTDINIPINDASSSNDMNDITGGNNIGMHNNNNKNVPHDITIVVLGYTLHKDGMPSRILKDRVESAVELYTRLREKDGLSPIFVLSGKSKPVDFDQEEAEYKSEAEAMKDLIRTMYDIEDRDIFMDSLSTNTAENANNTLTMMRKNNIERAIVVTSDFHLLRAQYIFQTVFPGDVALDFELSKTSDKTRGVMAPSERNLFSSSQEDLEKMGIIKVQGVKGYHPFRNLPRWRMIEREIKGDQRNLRELSEHSTCVDYGSNQGYFSTNLAQLLPQTTVISLEGEATGEYKSAATQHKEEIERLGIKNNDQCKTKIKTLMFKELVNKNHVFDYQLCLSVFHWFGMKTKEEFELVLLNLLLNSKTTFLELPEAMHYTGPNGHGQHEWQSVNIWYDGRNEDEILQDIKSTYDLRITWKTLGALMHDNKTVRKVIRIDVLPLEDKRSPLPINTLRTIYECEKPKEL